MAEGALVQEGMVATDKDELVNTVAITQIEARKYIAQNYPGLLFISQLPGIRGFSFQAYGNRRLLIEVQNNDFEGSYELQEAKEEDFSPFWALAEEAKRGGYLVAKNIRLTSSSKGQADIMADLRSFGVTLFIDGLCPQLQVFKEDPHAIDRITEDIRNDVLDMLYSASGWSGGDSPGKGYILGALPVNRGTLSTLSHEIGHQQLESYRSRNQVTDILNRESLTKEQKQGMFDRLSYQDERNCSAFGLRYMRNLYNRLRIQTRLSTTPPHLVNAALYVKQSFIQSSSFTEKSKPSPVPKTANQEREFRIASTIKSLVPSLN